MRLALVFVLGCSTTHPDARSAPLPPAVVRQVKSAHELRAPTPVADHTASDGAISIDGRSIPITGAGPVAAIAHGLARVPIELRGLLTSLVISPQPSLNDALYTRKYGTTVEAGMSTAISGEVTIFPHGLAELGDEDFFVKNFMHELGHAWSLRAWRDDPATEEAWRAAIASDPDPPSDYARMSFRNADALDEDAAEATSLYFIVRDTPAFERYRARMPARFALLAARFDRSQR